MTQRYALLAYTTIFSTNQSLKQSIITQSTIDQPTELPVSVLTIDMRGCNYIMTILLYLYYIFRHPTENEIHILLSLVRVVWLAETGKVL